MRVAHGAPAEAQDVAVRVDDRKDGTLEEHIARAFIAPADKPGGQQFVCGEPFLLKRLADTQIAHRRADAEAADDGVGQAAVFEIREYRFALRFPQIMVVQARGGLIGKIDALLEGTALLIVRVVLYFRQRHAQLLGQKGDGFLEAHMLDVHHKLDHALPPAFAAEAVIQLLLGVNAERWRFFVVKRAKASVAVPGFLQRYVGGYDLHDYPRACAVHPAMPMDIWSSYTSDVIRRAGALSCRRP